jgi:hypothetical protein
MALPSTNLAPTLRRFALLKSQKLIASERETEADRLEAALFNGADSIAEYSDQATLKHRLCLLYIRKSSPTSRYVRRGDWVGYRWTWGYA